MPDFPRGSGVPHRGPVEPRNPFKRFADYAIDRMGDRIAERLFERYGDDMTALVTNITGMFAMVPTSSPKPPEPPPAPGLRIVGDDD